MLPQWPGSLETRGNLDMDEFNISLPNEILHQGLEVVQVPDQGGALPNQSSFLEKRGLVADDEGFPCCADNFGVRISR
jgi:hypothetical protein